MIVFLRFLKDENGTAMTEYGILVAVIAVAVVALAVTLRGKIVQFFQDAIDALGQADGNSGIAR